MMIGVDPLGAALRELAAHERRHDGSRSTTDTVATFDHLDVDTCVEQQTGAPQTRQPGTHHDHLHVSSP
jgi:hypothetical protein